MTENVPAGGAVPSMSVSPSMRICTLPVLSVIV